ncbi:hypothetical protein G5714_002427 [Onychostoma macrolepis]|uniref:Uncharacterized protein n=1 Tax=Onychostoma macrolepis TaxID=369639 RepID=A0A7J6DGE7_9TELE|nr:hypothetical protein G5714_002427 [Onychostoma macrolepis]
MEGAAAGGCAAEDADAVMDAADLDFRFKTYAPVAFRYFRELFGIRPDDYLVGGALCHSTMWLFQRVQLIGALGSKNHVCPTQ